MKLTRSADIKTDVLIVGGGGAGLRAAIEARKSGVKVLLVAKARPGYSCNTAISRGTFSSATGWKDPRDNPQVHLKDTVMSGRYINDQRLVEVVAKGSPQQIRDLIDFGVTFFQKEGQIQSSLTPGHSYPRNVRGEHSFGQDFTVPLRQYALKIGCELIEGIWINNLIQRNKAVVGAVGIDRDGKIIVIQSKATILASGGAGQIYLNNNNAGGMTGDGYALAYDIGLPLRDMEFVQFYPTGLGSLGRNLILYEALVVRLGATLRNASGENILKRYGLDDPLLATRDRLARAVFREIREGRGIEGGVIMDLTTIPPQNMGTAREQIRPANLGFKERLIVSPTCHFFMGGIKINERGETEREGLWAAGEVCSGVHGANRLGGNAIAEIFVFGTVAGREAASFAGKANLTEPAPESINEALDDLKSLSSSRGKEVEGELREELKKAMWLLAGILREEKGLKECLQKISSLRQSLPLIMVEGPRDLHRAIELRNMLLVSEMICRAALLRAESRGSHFRSDYPQENNKDWLKNIIITRRGEDMALNTEPVQAYDKGIPNPVI